MSRVIAARLCPSIICTVLGDSPNSSIRVAKVVAHRETGNGVILRALPAVQRIGQTVPVPWGTIGPAEDKAMILIYRPQTEPFFCLSRFMLGITRFYTDGRRVMVFRRKNVDRQCVLA